MAERLRALGAAPAATHAWYEMVGRAIEPDQDEGRAPGIWPRRRPGARRLSVKAPTDSVVTIQDADGIRRR